MFFRDRSDYRRAAAASLALHATLLLLLLTPPGGRPPGASSSSADIAMVFEPAAHSGAAASASAARQAVRDSDPSARAEPSRPAPTIGTASRAPEPVAPPARPAPTPAPGLRVPAAAPRETTRAQTAARTGRPTMRTHERSAARFPAPMMRSFFIPSMAAASAAHPFSDDVLRGDGAGREGNERDTQYDLHGAERLGPDWGSEFMQWVEEHKPPYPERAIANNEDGDSTVQMVIDRYGTVRGVRIVQRSGSVWLDATLTGLFRDAHVPPFLPGTSPEDQTITFTMHYILER